MYSNIVYKQITNIKIIFRLIANYNAILSSYFSLMTVNLLIQCYRFNNIMSQYYKEIFLLLFNFYNLEHIILLFIGLFINIYYTLNLFTKLFFKFIFFTLAGIITSISVKSLNFLIFNVNQYSHNIDVYMAILKFCSFNVNRLLSSLAYTCFIVTIFIIVILCLSLKSKTNVYLLVKIFLIIILFKHE